MLIKVVFSVLIKKIITRNLKKKYVIYILIFCYQVV